MANFVFALFQRRWSLAGLFSKRDGPKDKEKPLASKLLQCWWTPTRH